MPELDEWRRDLGKKNNPRAYRDAFKREEKAIAERVAHQANVLAGSSPGAAKHFRKSIRGRATAKGASVYPSQKASYAAFWGAKAGKRSGWNRISYLRKNAATHTSTRTNAPGKSSARAVRTRRNLGGKPQFAPWVGSSWEAGGTGGPIAINPAVRQLKPWIEAEYLDAIAQVNAQTFPDRSGEKF